MQAQIYFLHAAMHIQLIIPSKLQYIIMLGFSAIQSTIVQKIEPTCIYNTRKWAVDQYCFKHE